MKIEKQVHGSVLLLVPHGPLVESETHEFRQSVEASHAQKAGRVIVDLRDVPYLDSTGIEALLECCCVGRGPGARTRLAGLTETCRAALDLTDVLGQVEVFDTVENAIRSCKKE